MTSIISRLRPDFAALGFGGVSDARTPPPSFGDASTSRRPPRVLRDDGLLRASLRWRFGVMRSQDRLNSILQRKFLFLE